jgi:hypothetical protein
MQQLILAAVNLEEVIVFSSNFYSMFREVYRIRILTPLYFKISYSTVNSKNYEAIIFYYLRILILVW